METPNVRQKIFIIEDDVNLLYALEAKFSVQKFTVTINTGVDSIEEMVHRLSMAKPDFLILDLLLPQIDGFELLRAIKSGHETSSIPVFVFTNLADQESRARGERLGADYYYIKSDFTLDEFVEKVIKTIKNKIK